MLHFHLRRQQAVQKVIFHNILLFLLLLPIPQNPATFRDCCGKLFFAQKIISVCWWLLSNLIYARSRLVAVVQFKQ